MDLVDVTFINAGVQKEQLYRKHLPLVYSLCWNEFKLPQYQIHLFLNFFDDGTVIVLVQLKKEKALHSLY